MKSGRAVSEASQSFSFSRRAWLLGMGQGAVGVALATRMGWLAIAQNAHFTQLSESNRVNLTLMPPRRGWIVDRHGVPIANNRTSFRVDIIPDRLEDRDRVLATLARLLALTLEQVARIGVDLDNAAGFQPVQVADKLDWQRFASVNVHLPELPGVAPSQTFARHYPAGVAVAHLTGYVGAATAEQYKATRDPLLVVPGFKLGKDGLEKVLEPRLRGSPGAKRNEVTARGKLIATLATRPGAPGANQRLTIDVGLQEYVARRLGTNSGSAVVLDCHTGEILALASMPAYDPNSFSEGISHLEWNMLSTDDHVPLMNKVTQGLYPPGSTVKPMHALALLEAGVTPSDGVVCTGAIRVGNGIFHCHQKRGHGHVDMERAIAQSCDIYFFEMARRLGYDRFAPIARTMGLEQKFDLPLAVQRFGTVPDSAWKLRHYKQKWTVADSINASIGQGYVLANPLQLAVMAARIASGRAIQPALLADQVREAHALPFDPAHLAIVRAGMDAVVNGGGTGGAARLLIPGVRLAAKTGTAQVRRITMAERSHGVLKNAALPFKLRDHALFVCFAPADNPRYAAGIVLEHGGHTSRSLDTPGIGRDIMTYLLDRPRALATLAELEPEWGGDITTRMAAQAAAYRAAQAPTPATDATKIDAVVPTDSAATEKATDIGNAAAAAMTGDGPTGNTVAEDGTTEGDDLPPPPGGRAIAMSRMGIVPEPLAQLPWRIIMLVLAIGSFGLVVLYSAAGGSVRPWAFPQGVRFFVFLGASVVLSRVPERIWKAGALPTYAVLVLALVAVEALGKISGGSQRWLDLGLIRLQPSELMKPAIILALARFYDILPLAETRRWSGIWPAAALIGVPAALVMLQPDLGTALMIGAGGVVIMFLAGVPLRLFVAGVLGVAVAAPLALKFVLHEYQRNRILIFLDPESDPLGTGYHISQSKIAIGSGGLVGKGFLHGTQSKLDYLPERQTDFVFATMAEEWGLVGGVLLILAFFLVIRWAMGVAERAPGRFARLTAAGLATTIFFYVAINLAMVMGLAPVVGIPLPLVSFGGSAQMTVLLSLGILMSIDRQNRRSARW